MVDSTQRGQGAVGTGILEPVASDNLGRGLASGKWDGRS